MTREEIEKRAAALVDQTLHDGECSESDLVDMTVKAMRELVVLAYEEAATTADKEIGSSRREIAAAIRSLKDSLAP